MKLIVKYLFLANIYFWGFMLHLDKYIFFWQTCFIWGVYLRVVLYSGKYGIINLSANTPSGHQRTVYTVGNY